MSHAVRSQKRRADLAKLEKGIKRDTVSLLARLNTPELLNRRSAAIAQANAGRTKESDDALENILIAFEKV